MSNNDKEKSTDNSVAIGVKIEELNSKIDHYNRELQLTGNPQNRFELIEEIKSLHKEVKRMNMKLLPKRYRSGDQ